MKKLYSRVLCATAISLFLSSTCVALVASDSSKVLKGQWAGLSDASNPHSGSEKVYFSASAGSISMRIEGNHTCVLEGLSGATKVDDEVKDGEHWDLTVTKSSDNGFCNRIAKGMLSIARLPNSGTLKFEARYINAGGEPVERTSLLGRYP